MQKLSTSMIPPHDLEAERSILGSCLLSETVVPEAINLVSADDFYSPNHQEIFKQIEKLFTDGKPVEMVTLVNNLKTANTLSEVGGAVYMADLLSIPATTSRIKTYCSIVRDKAVSRKLITLSSEISHDCYNGVSSQVVVEEFAGRMFEIAVDKNSKVESVGDLSEKVAADVEKRFKEKRSIIGVPTGLVDIDRSIHGFLESELIILAGRPAMGKTTFALNIMKEAADRGYPCLFFSLEMSKREIVEKFYSLIGRIDHERIVTGAMSDEDWPKMSKAQGKMKTLPIHIDDQGALSISQIRARARLNVQRHGIKLMIVDYLQLVKSGKESRIDEITEISGQLKAIAKELNIPVIALSQLSRKCEERKDKRPMLSDLRDSGAIEQDANIAMFVYRDEVYNPADDNPLKGIAEIIIAKNRRGRTGNHKLAFIGQHSRFESLANWS